MLATVSNVEFSRQIFFIVISPFIISGVTIPWPFSDFIALVFCISDLEEIWDSVCSEFQLLLSPSVGLSPSLKEYVNRCHRALT